MNNLQKKSLSQIFLKDRNIIRKLINALEIQAGDFILEIGSGKGAITNLLLNYDIILMIVEKDQRYCEELSKIIVDNKKFMIKCADILDFDIASELSPFIEKKKIVSNIPFQITGLIIRKILPLYEIFSSIVLVMQREVAKRIVAKSGKLRSTLTIFCEFFSEVDYLFDISKNSFSPIPNVDAAAIKFTLRKPSFDVEIPQFFLLVDTAFKQKRKTIKSSLKTIYDKEKIILALSKNFIDENSRPEMLSLEDFIKIFSTLEEIVDEK